MIPSLDFRSTLNSTLSTPYKLDNDEKKQEFYRAITQLFFRKDRFLPHEPFRVWVHFKNFVYRTDKDLILKIRPLFKICFKSINRIDVKADTYWLKYLFGDNIFI